METLDGSRRWDACLTVIHSLPVSRPSCVWRLQRRLLALILIVFVFSTGSWDGSIRLWKIDERGRSFSALSTIPAPGFVNSLQIVAPSLRANASSQRVATAEKRSKKKAIVLVAALSKEPRLGRWMRLKEGKEGALVAVIPIGSKEAGQVQP